MDGSANYQRCGEEHVLEYVRVSSLCCRTSRTALALRCLLRRSCTMVKSWTLPKVSATAYPLHCPQTASFSMFIFTLFPLYRSSRVTSYGIVVSRPRVLLRV